MCRSSVRSEPDGRSLAGSNPRNNPAYDEVRPPLPPACPAPPDTFHAPRRFCPPRRSPCVFGHPRRYQSASGSRGGVRRRHAHRLDHRHRQPVWHAGVSRFRTAKGAISAPGAFDQDTGHDLAGPAGQTIFHLQGEFQRPLRQSRHTISPYEALVQPAHAMPAPAALRHLAKVATPASDECN